MTSLKFQDLALSNKTLKGANDLLSGFAILFYASFYCKALLYNTSLAFFYKYLFYSYVTEVKSVYCIICILAPFEKF